MLVSEQLKLYKVIIYRMTLKTFLLILMCCVIVVVVVVVVGVLVVVLFLLYSILVLRERVFVQLNVADLLPAECLSARF